MAGKDVWVLPWLLNSMNHKFSNMVVSKQGSHEYEFSGMDIVLQNF